MKKPLIIRLYYEDYERHLRVRYYRPNSDGTFRFLGNNPSPIVKDGMLRVDLRRMEDWVLEGDDL